MFRIDVEYWKSIRKVRSSVCASWLVVTSMDCISQISSMGETAGGIYSIHYSHFCVNVSRRIKCAARSCAARISISNYSHRSRKIRDVIFVKENWIATGVVGIDCLVLTVEPVNMARNSKSLCNGKYHINSGSFNCFL